jgi:hypothetical protein
MSRTAPLLTLLFMIAGILRTDAAEPWPVVSRVDRQPLRAQVQRLSEAMRHLGTPFTDHSERLVSEAAALSDDDAFTRRIQELLDPLCLAAVTLEEGVLPRVATGKAAPALVEQGWRTFLVKVINPSGIRSRMRIDSPNARPLPHAPAEDVASRWLGLAMFDGQPLTPTLTGLPLEYRIVEVFSRDAGVRAARIEFAAPTPGAADVGRGSSIVADWRFGEEDTGWQAMNQVELEVVNGALGVTGTGDDPFFGASLPRPARPGNYVLRFWARAEEAGIGQVFWWTEERPQPDGAHVVAFNVEPGRDMLYEVPLAEEGHLTGVRIDPNAGPCRWRIDWIELASAEGGDDWGGIDVVFESVPSHPVTFRVSDAPDLPAMACFEITDEAGRVYPPQSKRLAPDFFFQRQIYRADGETIPLPAGRYTVRCSRGPETLPETVPLVVGDGPAEVRYEVKRWIDPSQRGYWSGDHHIHAAGCAHYENPTQGVQPPDMLRHCMGEDLKVGCCLTWGPCFDFQKRFFTGSLDHSSRYPYLIRYDVEVSGFGSHASGHLNLLRLRRQIPPGGESKEHWPTLGLNTLRWAKRQGAVCGPAHSASGLTRFVDRVPGTDGEDGPGGLPTFSIPAFDGIGANEFIMDVTHTVEGPAGTAVPAVDFISTMNSDRTAEWNMWYHVLNCGFRVRASGETDFPCMSGERVGLGRVYARVDGSLDFDRWCDAIAAGRSYVSDGRTHLMEFTASAAGAPPYEIGTGDGTLAIPAPRLVTFRVTAACLEAPGTSRKVELVVNGFPVSEVVLPADGKERTIEFEHEIRASAWAAVRMFPTAHTNPAFITVAGAPIRADARSARWCLQSVEQCWRAKAATYHESERRTAEADYATAREVFSRIFEECVAASREPPHP